MYEYSLATVPTFYAQVERAFAFLPATYDCRLHAQHLDAIEDFRDTEAMVVYLGDKIGDSDQVGGRITNKRFKLLQSDLPGVLDGLARATERYASDILRGDLSIYPEAQAYRDQKPWPMGTSVALLQHF
jgi:hypothetical protein